MGGRCLSIAHILIGVPGAGKSTWTTQYMKDRVQEGKARPIIISSDEIIEEIAAKMGVNYSEAYKVVDFDEIVRDMYDRFMNALKDNHPVIIDRTNTTIKARRRFLLKIPKHYRKVAVVFHTPDDIFERLRKRAKDTGKHIPEKVVQDFINKVQIPDEFEGFDEIIHINKKD